MLHSCLGGCYSTHCNVQMLSSCLTNHADIKDLWGRTAVDMAREYRHHALANYVEVFQPRPRGVLPIRWYL